MKMERRGYMEMDWRRDDILRWTGGEMMYHVAST